MNPETDFQRDIPAENIRNVGVLTEFFESGFLQLLLDYAEPHEPHYTEVELACPIEVLSYSSPPLPSEMTRYWKHSGTNYQFNLTTEISRTQSIPNGVKPFVVFGTPQAFSSPFSFRQFG